MPIIATKKQAEHTDHEQRIQSLEHDVKELHRAFSMSYDNKPDVTKHRHQHKEWDLIHSRNAELSKSNSREYEPISKLSVFAIVVGALAFVWMMKTIVTGMLIPLLTA